MFNIECLANIMAEKVAGELNFDDDKREVIAYGTFALIQMTFSLILVIIFGQLFSVTIEALIISFTVSILRKSSGGVHASSSSICIMIGTIVSVGLAILCKVNYMISVYKLLEIGCVTFILAYYVVYKVAPVDSESKPIKKEQKRKLLKKRSIIILSIYVIIVLCSTISYYFISDKKLLIYILCIYSGTLWQVLTLTKIGHSILNKVDSFFNNIL